MAPFIVKRATVLAGNHELAALSHQFDFGAPAPEKECTNFASEGWQEYMQGLRSSEVSLELYQSVPDPEKDLYNRFKDSDSIPIGFTFTRPAAPADLCWFLRGFLTRHGDKRQIGEIAGLSLVAKGDKPLVRGKFLEAAVNAVTGTSTAINMDVNVEAGQRLYFALWVTGLLGVTPSLTVTLQSDDAVGFPSPVDRIVSNPITDANGSWFYGSVDGLVSDKWWRISRAVTGGGASATYFAAIGIAPIE